MNEKETIEHEAIKFVLKMGIMNNASMNSEQKRIALQNLDNAAKKADWFMEMLRQCGYLA